MAAYESPGYFNHWPNAYGMSQFKYMGSRGICAAKDSGSGRCLGNDSRCRGHRGSVMTEDSCTRAQARCTWQAQEAEHQRVYTKTTAECQQKCGMDPECTGYSRSGFCKLYT